MDKGIKVSVVCVAYNQMDYIRDALDGIVMQKTNFEFEVIVHDDGSIDGTAEIIKEYAAKYPFIIPVLQSDNQTSRGVVITREFIYPLVSGEFVALCDSDDYWTDPLKLQKQADALDAHPELDICVHRTLVTRDDRPRRFVAPATRTRVLGTEEVIIGGGWYVTTSSIMCRRGIYVKQTPLRDVITIDYALQMQASARGGMYYLEDCMAVYRLRSKGSWSSANRHGIPMETSIRLLSAMDEYTGGRFHEAVELRKRIRRSQWLQRSGKKYLALLAPGEIGITLRRIGISLRRLAIKFRYSGELCRARRMVK